jgi:translation initiation factor 1A
MEQSQEVVRVRLPRRNEVLCVIEELLGASRFRTACRDGNKRICRIPGKFRKRIKVRTGDIVLVKPWDIQPKEKGDIIWIYNRTHANWLRRKGFV